MENGADAGNVRATSSRGRFIFRFEESRTWEQSDNSFLQ